MNWHQLCDVTEVPDGTSREFLIAGRVIALFHSQQQWFALDGMCAHQGGPIAQGQLSGKCITCPWHGWQYDVSNGTNLLTGKQMLDSFPVEQRDQQVWVQLSE